MAELKQLLIEQSIEQSPIEVGNEADFKVGNSKFSDDIWDFSNIVAKDFEHLKPGKLKLNFSPYASCPRIKNVIKHYILSELTLNTFNSVKRKFAAFAHLPTFLNQNAHITSFEHFTLNELKSYFEFIVDLPLSGVSKKKAGQVIKELLLRGSKRGWDTVRDTVGMEALYDELIIRNKGIREETKFGPTKKVLPDEQTVNLLINTAQKHLSLPYDDYEFYTVRHFLSAASIILMTQIGFRISECLKVKAGCLKVVNGEYQIVYETDKTTKSKTEVIKPANEMVVNTIKKLEEFSAPFRKESGLNNLFLIRDYYSKKITLANHSNWNRDHLKQFIQKYDIRDEQNNQLKLTSHYFRHIFATYALQSGMKIHDVAEMLNHKSIMMTETYDHSQGQKQKVIENILTGETPISSTNKIVLESIEGEENPFRGKTIDQIEKMRRALKIELLPHGLCLHHPMRGEPCAQDGVCLGCNEFIASADHLHVYRKRLEKVEKELANSPADSIYTTKLNYQQGKLVKYITDLQLKIAMKEGSSNDNG